MSLFDKMMPARSTVNQNAINYYCATGGLVIPVLEG
jgi:hypothetical protein